MENPKVNTGKSENPNLSPDAPGLQEFFSAQVNEMLAQYENINYLLGNTSNWTPTGDLCEILFRDLLRKFLPPKFSVDKGFYYGRAVINRIMTHCPEIDILIHDCESFKPLYRKGDFVIVQPQAVRGMIQVKRSIHPASLKKALDNVVDAKRHLLRLPKNNPGYRQFFLYLGARVFTAVVSFMDEPGSNPAYYQMKLLQHWVQECKEEDSIGMDVLPSFIGSLKGSFLVWNERNNPSNRRYRMMESIHDKVNICGQALLKNIFELLVNDPDVTPQFNFPSEISPKEFYLIEYTCAVRNPDQTIKLTRNDGISWTFRLGTEGTTEIVHLIEDPNNDHFKITDSLRSNPLQRVLNVLERNEIRRYDFVDVGKIDQN